MFQLKDAEKSHKLGFPRQVGGIKNGVFVTINLVKKI